MNLKLEIEFSKTEILAEIDALKKQIDDMRPLPEDVEGRVMQKLRLDWNYNSNAIEGNKLSYGETAAFLSEGITAKGKPLKDHLDIRGHNEAISFLIDIVKDSRPISESDIRTLHKIILVEPYEVKAQTDTGVPTKKRINLGEYKTSPNHVKTSTGELHYYATPEETPAKMQELMEWYTEVSNNKSIHPVVIASMFHHKFVAIHPFDDGNGRLSRILMNLIIMQNGYPPIVVKMENRQNYYALLRRADVGENWPFVEYIADRLQQSLQLYVKAAKGGDIEEDEDIDKEIVLLKMQLNGGMVAKEKKSKENTTRVFLENIFPTTIKVENKSKNFQEYFFSPQNWIRFYYTDGNSSLEFIGESYKEKYKTILENKDKELNYVIIELGFKEYKDPENSFSFNVNIKVSFEKFYYKISSDQELIVSKLYHENLTSEDTSKILKCVIKDFKEKLSKSIENKPK